MGSFKKASQHRIYTRSTTTAGTQLTQRFVTLRLQLSVCPARNLHIHVDDVGGVALRVDGDVMPPRDRIAIALQPNSPSLILRSKFSSNRKYINDNNKLLES